MVTAAISATDRREEAAYTRLPRLVKGLHGRAPELTSEEFRLLYAEVRAALRAPSSLPMCYSRLNVDPWIEGGKLPDEPVDVLLDKLLKLAEPHLMPRGEVVRTLWQLRGYIN